MATHINSAANEAEHVGLGRGGSGVNRSARGGSGVNRSNAPSV